MNLEQRKLEVRIELLGYAIKAFERHYLNTGRSLYRQQAQVCKRQQAQLIGELAEGAM